jgi:hypothetical protein
MALPSGLLPSAPRKRVRKLTGWRVDLVTTEREDRSQMFIQEFAVAGVVQNDRYTPESIDRLIARHDHGDAR